MQAVQGPPEHTAALQPAAPPGPPAPPSRGWYEEGSQAAPEVLTGFQHLTPHFAPAPQLRPELVRAVPGDVWVHTATNHWLGAGFDNWTHFCPYRGMALGCHLSRSVSASSADALWFHAPNMRDRLDLPPRAFPGQASAGYYPGGCWVLPWRVLGATTW